MACVIHSFARQAGLLGVRARALVEISLQQNVILKAITNITHILCGLLSKNTGSRMSFWCNCFCYDAWWHIVRAKIIVQILVVVESQLWSVITIGNGSCTKYLAMATVCNDGRAEVIMNLFDNNHGV